MKTLQQVICQFAMKKENTALGTWPHKETMQQITP